MSLEEVIHPCILLVDSVHVTTTSLLGQAILCFDANPMAMEQLGEHLEAIQMLLKRDCAMPPDLSHSPHSD